MPQWKLKDLMHTQVPVLIGSYELPPMYLPPLIGLKSEAWFLQRPQHGKELVCKRVIFQKRGRKPTESCSVQYEVWRHPYGTFSTVSSSHEGDEWCVRRPCGKLGCVKPQQLQLCLLLFVVAKPTAICHSVGTSAYSRVHSPSCSLIHHIESWCKTLDFN